MRRPLVTALAALSLAAVAVPALAQPDPAPRVAAQKAAMAELSMMDGVWRGQAWTMDRTGTKHMVTQTERVGGFLDGSIKVVEGRGYNADGSIGFNAFAVIAYDPDKTSWTMRSWTSGQAGDFPLTPTGDGFIWTLPAGPNATMRYTAVIQDGTWHEVGDYVAEGQPPRRVFEMTLKRLGDSDWPAGDAVPMQ